MYALAAETTPSYLPPCALLFWLNHEAHFTSILSSFAWSMADHKPVRSTALRACTNATEWLHICRASLRFWKPYSDFSESLLLFNIFTWNAIWSAMTRGWVTSRNSAGDEARRSHWRACGLFVSHLPCRSRFGSCNRLHHILLRFASNKMNCTMSAGEIRKRGNWSAIGLSQLD